MNSSSQGGNSTHVGQGRLDSLFNIRERLPVGQPLPYYRQENNEVRTGNPSFHFKSDVLKPRDGIRKLSLPTREDLPVDLEHGEDWDYLREKFDPVRDLAEHNGLVLRPKNLDNAMHFSDGLINVPTKGFDNGLDHGVFNLSKTKEQMQRFFKLLCDLGPGAEKLYVFSDPRAKIEWNGGGLPLITGGETLLPDLIEDPNRYIAALANFGNLRFSYPPKQIEPAFDFMAANQHKPCYVVSLPADLLDLYSKDQEHPHAPIMDESGIDPRSPIAQLINELGNNNVYIYTEAVPALRCRQEIGAETLDLSGYVTPRLQPLTARALRRWKNRFTSEAGINPNSPVKVLHLAPNRAEIAATAGKDANLVVELATRALPVELAHMGRVGSPEFAET